jgi:hypothetical protein
LAAALELADCDDCDAINRLSSYLIMGDHEQDAEALMARAEKKLKVRIRVDARVLDRASRRTARVAA